MMTMDSPISFKHSLLTPENCRAGRALLGLSQAELAQRAGVGRLTVVHFECGARLPMPARLKSIRAVLEASGVNLLRGGAVLRKIALPAADSRPVEEVVRILREAAGALKGIGAGHASVLDSRARGVAAKGEPGIEVLVELDGRRRLDPWDFARIAMEIKKRVGGPIHVWRRDRLKPEVAARVLRHEIQAF